MRSAVVIPAHVESSIVVIIENGYQYERISSIRMIEIRIYLRRVIEVESRGLENSVRRIGVTCQK